MENFEKIQRSRMIKEANQYARSLPFLEFIYIGQFPMSITGGKNGERDTSPLVDERDEYWTALKRMFGSPESTD